MTQLLSFLFLVGLLMMTPAAQAGDSTALKGDPIPVEATITIDLASEEPAIAARQAAGLPVTHLQSTPGVVEGQRIPLPRTADGACITAILVGVQGSSTNPPVEFSTDGTRFTQHDISQQVGTSIDETTCELVVTTARAADHVKTKRVKRLSPRVQRDIDALPTSEPQSSLREYENPRILYLWYSRAKSSLYYIYYGQYIQKMYSWMDMSYYDQPSRRILGLHHYRNLEASALPSYWISNQSWVQFLSPWQAPSYALGVINHLLGGGIGWNGSLNAVVYAWPYGSHWEGCWATPPYGRNKVTNCQWRHYLSAAYYQ
jgi:hypothetical protein